MTIPDFRKFLGVLSNNQLSENLLSNIVVRYYDKIQFESAKDFFDSVFDLYAEHEKESFPELLLDELEEIELPEGDYRLKNVRISNVRGIGEKIEDHPFGIDFTNEDGILQNAIILGVNGSGKSSLFGAMEYIYSNQIGEADLRSTSKLSDKEYQDFLTRFDSSWESTFCKIDTKSGEFDLKNRLFGDERQLQLISPQNHFISDQDIYESGKLSYYGKDKSDSTFHYQVALSLGLEEFLNKSQEINRLSSYQRRSEQIHLTALEKELNKHKLDLSKWQEEIRNFVEKKNSIEVTSNDSSSKGIKSTKEIVQDLQRIDYPDVPEAKRLQESINKYKNAYKKYVSFEDRQSSKSEIEFLRLSIDLLDHEHIPGNCPLCNDSKLDQEEIKEKVLAKIDKLQDLGLANNEVNNLYLQIMEQLKSIHWLINRSADLLGREVSETMASPRFVNLLESQNNLLESLQNRSFADEMLILEEIISVNIQSSEGYEELNTYLSQHNEFLQDDVVKVLNLLSVYSSVRQREFKVVLDSLKDEPKTREQLLKEYDSEILQRDKAIKASNKRIEELNKEIVFAEKRVRTKDNIKNDANEFQKVVSEQINELIISSVEPIKHTIENILTDYLNEDDNDVRLEISTGHDDSDENYYLTAKIVNNSTKEVLSPNKYFNTFRYRLFSMMVSCSIAIASRRATNVNLPLIMDDLFFASDYVSRRGIKAFLIRLIEIFKNQTPELKLQFILFTHDDAVFNYAVEALSETEPNIKKNTIVGRLFPYKDSGEHVSGSENDKYWSLLLEMNKTRKSDLIDEILAEI